MQLRSGRVYRANYPLNRPNPAMQEKPDDIHVVKRAGILSLASLDSGRKQRKKTKEKYEDIYGQKDFGDDTFFDDYVLPANAVLPVPPASWFTRITDSIAGLFRSSVDSLIVYEKAVVKAFDLNGPDDPEKKPDETHKQIPAYAKRCMVDIYSTAARIVKSKIELPDDDEEMVIKKILVDSRINFNKEFNIYKWGDALEELVQLLIKVIVRGENFDTRELAMEQIDGKARKRLLQRFSYINTRKHTQLELFYRQLLMLPLAPTQAEDKLIRLPDFMTQNTSFVDIVLKKEIEALAGNISYFYFGTNRIKNLLTTVYEEIQVFRGMPIGLRTLVTTRGYRGIFDAIINRKVFANALNVETYDFYAKEFDKYMGESNEVLSSVAALDAENQDWDALLLCLGRYAHVFVESGSIADLEKALQSASVSIWAKAALVLLIPFDTRASDSILPDKGWMTDATAELVPYGHLMCGFTPYERVDQWVNVLRDREFLNRNKHLTNFVEFQIVYLLMDVFKAVGNDAGTRQTIVNLVDKGDIFLRVLFLCAFDMPLPRLSFKKRSFEIYYYNYDEFGPFYTMLVEQEFLRMNVLRLVAEIYRMARWTDNWNPLTRDDRLKRAKRVFKSGLEKTSKMAESFRLNRIYLVAYIDSLYNADRRASLDLLEQWVRYWLNDIVLNAFNATEYDQYHKLVYEIRDHSEWFSLFNDFVQQLNSGGNVRDLKLEQAEVDITGRAITIPETTLAARLGVVLP